VWISYSQLKLFEQCPRSYKFRYIEKSPPKVKPILIMANSVHAALKDFFLISDATLRTKEALEGLLRKAWRINPDRKKAFANTQEEKTWGEKALAMLGNFYEKQDIKANPLAVEELYKAQFDSGIVLCGKVDRIDTDQDGSLRIIDYKTGKAPKDGDKFLTGDYQLGMYGILVRKKMFAKIEKIMYIFLEDNTVISVKPTVEYLDNILEKILGMAKTVTQEKVYPPNPGSFCRICDYFELCDSALKTVSPEAVEQEAVPF